MLNSHVTRLILILAVICGSFATGAATAASYTTQQLPSGRSYLKLNNNLYALTMRQDAEGVENLHIVIENWNPGYYSEFRPGGLPGTTRSVAVDFNDSLAIAGYATTVDSNGTPTAPDRAFVYSNGVFTDLSALPPLNSPGTSNSRALGINNNGDVVGYWLDASGATRGFLYRNGVLTDIGTLNPDRGFTVAHAVNDSGGITGLSYTAPSSTQQSMQHAVSYVQPALQDINPPFGPLGSYGVAINNRGDIVGNARSGTHTQACFLFQQGVITEIAPVGSSGFAWCAVSDINASGIAVGESSANPYPPSFPTNVAFVYSDGQARDLNLLINPNDPVAVNHLALQTAFAINDSGYILAKRGNDVYLVTPENSLPPTDNAYYNFEQTTHNWYAEGDPIATVTSSTAQRFAGTAALAVQFNGSGYVSIGGMYPPPLAAKTVLFHIFLPADASIEWVQPFVLEDYAGNWAWHGNWQPVGNLQLGAWNTLELPIPSDATPGYRIGVEFYTSQPYTGTAYIDSVSF